jgi:1,4-alpha-glucan branching enzyme
MGCAVADGPVEPPGETFRCPAPDASDVLLVGDFTEWQKQPVPMKPGLDGIWTATLRLQPGAHHYMFIVDGKWSDDPACAQRVKNEFGGQNMVREVA